MSNGTAKMKMKLFPLALPCATLLLAGSSLAAATQEVHVHVDPSVTHQEVLGWGIPLFFEEKHRFGASMQSKLIELFTRDMGCNAYRWEINRREWEDAIRVTSDTILQPTLAPLRANVGSFLFHGFEPGAVVRNGESAERSAARWSNAGADRTCGVMYVGSNWQRWE
jgi:hypothetical protein